MHDGLAVLSCSSNSVGGALECVILLLSTTLADGNRY